MTRSCAVHFCPRVALLCPAPGKGGQGMTQGASQSAAAPTSLAHAPVMPRQVLELMAPAPGEVFVDATLGRGGHARLLCQALGAQGTLLGLDRDTAAHTPEALAWTSKQGCKVVAMRRPFSQLEAAVADAGIQTVDGVLADLGVSSPQFDDASRGFSFRGDGPLDMRMDPTSSPTAAELVASLSADQLANVIFTLGEERHSRRVARALKREPTPTTTRDAADRVSSAVPRSKDGLHPATRTFQALRMAVNREREELAALLAALPRVLRVGGRAAIISFHSGEDRAVKQAFNQELKGCICPPQLPYCACGRWPRLALLNRKPLMADDDEVAANPRARSARLRAVRRLPDPEGQVSTW